VARCGFNPAAPGSGHLTDVKNSVKYDVKYNVKKGVK
jgi:hypothetical protein